MISGGMEIMLSRKIDTRAVYVIGVSTLLAMSEKVFPAYFRALPKPIQTFTSSPLALGLTFAIGLTLIFRLGTLQSREIKWTDSTASINSINAFLQDQAKAWRIPEAIIEACGESWPDHYPSFLRGVKVWFIGDGSLIRRRWSTSGSATNRTYTTYMTYMTYMTRWLVIWRA